MSNTEILTPLIRESAYKSLSTANVRIKGHFILASGAHSLEKLEMDRLFDDDVNLKIIVGLLGQIITKISPDHILGVPSGGQRLAQSILQSSKMNAHFSQLERVPGGSKQDFRFREMKDQKMVLKSSRVCIIEDVVSTLSSVDGVLKLLNPAVQDVLVVAIWRRGEVNQHIASKIKDQIYLIEELILTYTAHDCPFEHDK